MFSSDLFRFLSLPRIVYLEKERRYINRYGCTVSRKMLGLYTRTLGKITEKDIGKHYIVDQYSDGSIREYLN